MKRRDLFATVLGLLTLASGRADAESLTLNFTGEFGPTTMGWGGPGSRHAILIHGYVRFDDRDLSQYRARPKTSVIRSSNYVQIR